MRLVDCIVELQDDAPKVLRPAEPGKTAGDRIQRQDELAVELLLQLWPERESDENPEKLFLLYGRLERPDDHVDVDTKVRRNRVDLVLCMLLPQKLIFPNLCASSERLNRYYWANKALECRYADSLACLLHSLKPVVTLNA